MPFRPVGISGAYNVAALATEYFAFGPVRVGSEINALIAHLNGVIAGTHTFSPVLCDSNQANAANHATGIPLIEQSETRLNGQPALLWNNPANGFAVHTISTSRKVLDTNKWVVIGHTTTVAGNAANVLVSLLGFYPVSEAEAGGPSGGANVLALTPGIATPSAVVVSSGS